MSDLYLTDDQVAELAKMGIAGEIAADDLRLWRACVAAPWEHGDGACGGFICYHARPADNTGPPYTEIPDDGREPVILGVAEEDRIAICQSRNTAELRAAAMLHQKKQEIQELAARIAEGVGRQNYHQKIANEHYTKLDAIAKTYAEIKQ